MSAIDALTTSNSNSLDALLSAQSKNKKNSKLDFNQVLAAAMQPTLPGMSDSGSASNVLQMTMVQQMESLVSELSDTVALIKASQDAAKATAANTTTPANNQSTTAV